MKTTILLFACVSQFHISVGQFMKLDSAYVEGGPSYYPGMGDLWMTTWGSDDKIYSTWGDGTGLGICYPRFSSDSCRVVDTAGIDAELWYMDIFCGLGWTNCGETIYCPCEMTDAGMSVWEGPINGFTKMSISSYNIPTGNPWFPADTREAPMVDRNDKPSSILWLNDTLFLAAHEPAGEPEIGYLAFSVDSGATWTDYHDSSVWDSTSNFRILMFCNMGQAYSARIDDYVYAYGIPVEAGWPNYDKKVYLTRVHMINILNYERYEYLVGYNVYGDPLWSPSEGSAIGLDNLESFNQASAIFHEQTESFLFLTAEPPRLYQSPTPWGPWEIVASDLRATAPPSWHSTGFVTGLIPKDAGSDWVYFTASSTTDYDFSDYQLTIGMLRLVNDTTSTLTSDVVDDNSGIEIFPNPSQGYFTIIHPPSKYEIEINIIDLLGKKVYYSNHPASIEGIKIKVRAIDFPKGVYIVKSSEYDQPYKVVIQ